MNLLKYSDDVGTIDEAVEAASVPNQHNEESIGYLQDNKKQTYNHNVEMKIF